MHVIASVVFALSLAALYLALNAAYFQTSKSFSSSSIFSAFVGRKSKGTHEKSESSAEIHWGW
jgi:hypothetical protein